MDKLVFVYRMHTDIYIYEPECNPLKSACSQLLMCELLHLDTSCKKASITIPSNIREKLFQIEIFLRVHLSMH